jgi:hypothetical protein
MLYMEINAVYFEIHKNNRNTQFGENLELFNFKRGGA